MEQFRAALTQWHDKVGVQIQQSAARLGISHTLMSRLLHGKTGLSIAQAEHISNELGKELVDMLEEGRILLGHKKMTKKNNPYSYEQIRAINAFNVVLSQGGEGAEILIKAIIDLAEKKQAEAVDPSRQKDYKSAS